MSKSAIRRDERTESVENASYRLAHLVASVGLLVSFVYRTYVLHQSSWDLLAILVIGGLVAGFYQGRQGVWTRRWALAAAVGAAAVVVAVVAVLVAVTR